ncbi:Kinase-like protein [Mycena sanguinolenta]|uniref:Kinase-like protein n=1 Tax=Mycena sanguinolenta TaxID=230812 RepID=A0A8H6ZA30_9AGAR|nr:Kinase-like protein [Mycena sanguinolenta]
MNPGFRSLEVLAAPASWGGRSINDLTQFQKVLDGYVLSMASSNVISAVVGSLESRKKLMDFSSQLGLTNDPKLRAAQRADDERIATTFVSIFNSALDEDAVLRLEGDSAQHFLDVVQGALDKGFLLAEEDSRMARRMIRKLSERCDMLSSSLFIAGVSGREEHPTFGGGYGDIFRASYNEKPVALKRMRYFLRGAELRHVHLKFCREALVWKDLRHPNILAFLGIDRDSFPSTLSMGSPWMEHGTILNYLQNNGHANVDKSLYEIAQGLQYLHSRNVIHGDLRGANILVNENWNACLADFGLSKFSDATSSMTIDRGGSLYWMAPELIVPDRFGLQFARTRATDVYAFGCVCLELYTGRPPFADLREPAALLKIMNNERPQPPVGPPVMSDALWDHVSACWAEHPQARPETQLVVQTLKSFQPLPLILEVLTKESHSGKDPETERAEIEDRVENANLLSQALAMATSEELGAGVIKVQGISLSSLLVIITYVLTDARTGISPKIPWASVGAERSRAAKDAKGKQRAVRTRKTGNAVVPTLNSITPNVVSSNGIDRNANGDGMGGEVEDGGQTREEELLEGLLTTNQHLMEALALYDDLKRGCAREGDGGEEPEGDCFVADYLLVGYFLKQYMTEVLHPSHVNIGGSTSHHHSRSPSPSLAPVPVSLQPSYSGHPPPPACPFAIPDPDTDTYANAEPSCPRTRRRMLLPRKANASIQERRARCTSPPTKTCGGYSRNAGSGLRMRIC